MLNYTTESRWQPEPSLRAQASMYDDYLCACCLTPCASCVGSRGLGVAFSQGEPLV